MSKSKMEIELLQDQLDFETRLKEQYRIIAESLHTRSQELTNENTRLKDKIEEITKYSQETNDELASVEEERDRLFDLLERMKEENSRLCVENRELKVSDKENKDAWDEVNKLKAEIARLEKKNRDLKVNYENVCGQYRDSEHWRKVYEARNSQQAKNCEEYRLRNEALEKKLADIRAITKEK